MYDAKASIVEAPKAKARLGKKERAAKRALIESNLNGACKGDVRIKSQLEGFSLGPMHGYRGAKKPRGLELSPIRGLRPRS
jgi:hypothetical protein